MNTELEIDRSLSFSKSDDVFMDPVSQPVSNAKGIRIIVVDQSSADMAFLRAALARDGSHFVEETSGRTAVSIVQNSIDNAEPFDIVVVDRKPSDIDGFETTRLLREVGFAGPIIGTSWSLTTNIKDEWSDAGCTEVLEKPVDLIQLIDTVAQLILDAAGQ